MPITTHVASHGAETWTDEKARSIEDFLRLSSPEACAQSQRIVQSSITRRDLRLKHIVPSANGFVWAAIHAYNGHHHLKIRPEDIWFAILSQINLFIKRQKCKDRKEIYVEDSGSLEFANFGIMAARLVNAINGDASGPDLTHWTVPRFSMTRGDGQDMIVALILTLGVNQRNFTYEMRKLCGIPSVTLLGDRKDWEIMIERLDLLPQYFGEVVSQRNISELHAFITLLRPVIQGFIDTFDAPSSDAVKQFWSKIIVRDPSHCKFGKMSGWITAFCCWDGEGRPLYGLGSASGLPPGPFNRGCEVDGTLYHTIRSADIPSGITWLPVTVCDKGETYHARIYAGSLGFEVTGTDEAAGIDHEGREISIDDTHGADRSLLDSLQPFSGWCMIEVDKPTGDEDEAPVPRAFMYYDDFDEEAPVPGSFMYEETIK